MNSIEIITFKLELLHLTKTPRPILQNTKKYTNHLNVFVIVAHFNHQPLRTSKRITLKHASKSYAIKIYIKFSPKRKDFLILSL